MQLVYPVLLDKPTPGFEETTVHFLAPVPAHACDPSTPCVHCDAGQALADALRDFIGSN